MHCAIPHSCSAPLDFEAGHRPFLCGLDEAGCGPLAGPVTAGCVILNDDFDVCILNDSKKMSAKKRAAARLIILRDALWGIGVADEKTIDKINILQSRLLAMRLAFYDMAKRLPKWMEQRGIDLSIYCGASGLDYGKLASAIEAVADGTFCPDLPCPVRCEPKADGKYPAVMAASIIAKEERDCIMRKMDALYPQYGYAKHKGYPTKEHIKILHEIGPSPIQRMTFKYR